MIRVLEQLDNLESSLFAVVENIPEEARYPIQDYVDPYICAIRRKCKNVLFHQAIIKGVNWKMVHKIGQQESEDGKCEKLTIRHGDVSVTFQHNTTVKDHTYIACDGFVTGIVNITDTLGRLLNLCIELKIDERGATLFAIKKEVKDSPLGQLLADPPRTAWLRRVRDLRGRCQHADLESVLNNPSRAYGGSEEPCIPVDYVWSNPANATPVTKYVAAVTDKAETLLCDCIAVIVQHGTKAIALK